MILSVKYSYMITVLSRHSNTKFVMSGITLGAGDYLTKPVRIEEFKNIWQHAIWKNMSNPKYNSSGNGHMRAKLHEGGGEDTVHELMQPWGNDCNAEVERYREKKDEVDNGGITQSVEGSSVQKKRRVVWSAELHQMFVEAVNLLGVDSKWPL